MILIGIMIVLAVVAAYFWFGDSLSFSTSQGESGIDSEYANVLSDVTRLKSIQLDTEIVGSEKFKRLVAPLLPALPNVKPGGRNPYIPF
jgi:hypothetical protein